MNSVRHGRATTVTLRVRREQDGLHVTLTDNGTGFEPSAVGWRCFGLASMESRARELGGSFRVDSLPGVGTTVEVSLP